MHKYFSLFLVSYSTFSRLHLLYSHFAPTGSTHSSNNPTDTNQTSSRSLCSYSRIHSFILRGNTYFNMSSFFILFFRSLRVYVSYCLLVLLFLLFHLLPYVELYSTELCPYLPVCSTLPLLSRNITLNCFHLPLYYLLPYLPYHSSS